jgi:hypothetical protein
VREIGDGGCVLCGGVGKESAGTARVVASGFEVNGEN